MVKRKLITGVVVLAVLFLNLIFVKDVKAVASCVCNVNYFNQYQEQLKGFDRVNGQDNPEAISSNNCPSKATYTLTSPPREEDVFPLCIRSQEGNSWGCHCFASYTAGDITQIPGFTYEGGPAGGTSTECKSGGNCCVCGLDGKLVDYCDSTMVSQCASTIDSSAYSNNCSCISKPVEVTYTGTDPFCENTTDINTALGCVPTTPSGFTEWLLTRLFGIAGGISFLLMVYGFILVATSSGDEKKLQGAKETITSAIIGLLVSIFAIFLFRLIAVNILKIPGIN